MAFIGSRNITWFINSPVFQFWLAVLVVIGRMIAKERTFYWIGTGSFFFIVSIYKRIDWNFCRSMITSIPRCVADSNDASFAFETTGLDQVQVIFLKQMVPGWLFLQFLRADNGGAKKFICLLRRAIVHPPCTCKTNCCDVVSKVWASRVMTAGRKYPIHPRFALR